jgi:hypothetical protein
MPYQMAYSYRHFEEHLLDYNYSKDSESRTACCFNLQDLRIQEWDRTPCNVVKRNRHFGRTCCLRIHIWGIKGVISQEIIISRSHHRGKVVTVLLPIILV